MSKNTDFTLTDLITGNSVKVLQDGKELTEGDVEFAGALLTSEEFIENVLLEERDIIESGEDQALSDTIELDRE